MFKSIKINNLRVITELEIDNFGQINVLVGHNSCGKTTKLYRIERKDEKFRAVDYTKNMLAESLESDWEVR